MLKIFDSQSVKPFEELVTIPQLFALPLKGSFTVYDAHGLQGSYKSKKLQGANKTSWLKAELSHAHVPSHSDLI